MTDNLRERIKAAIRRGMYGMWPIDETPLYAHPPAVVQSEPNTSGVAACETGFRYTQEDWDAANEIIACLDAVINDHSYDELLLILVSHRTAAALKETEV